MPAFPLLSRTLSAEMYNRLLTMLPPPADDSIEAQIGRDTAALAGIDSLGPIRSAEEASLAITVVAADTHAHDAFRLAARNTGDIKVVSQCRSQAALMLRTRAKAVERLEKLQSQHPVEVPAEDQTRVSADAQDTTPPATTETPPQETISREQQARELVAAKAMYARVVGRPDCMDTNKLDDIVSTDDLDPVPAVIMARTQPPAWQPSA